MKNTVSLSSKYQVVIPKAARKKMGIDRAGKLSVSKITDNEITFRKEPELEDFFGAFKDAFGPEPTKALRKMRDEDRD